MLTARTNRTNGTNRTATRRDCQCRRARHRHGTRDAYNRDQCRCDPCTAANAAAAGRHRLRRAEQAWHGTSPWAPAIGTRRRLQALTAAGWSTGQLADRLGVTKSAVAQLRSTSQHRVLATTAGNVATLYEQCLRRTPPGRYQLRARRYAEARAWPSPAEWDGLDLDDPYTRPGQLQHTPGTQAEHTATWQNEAACAAENPRLFDLPGPRTSHVTRLHRAAAICGTCPVATRCLVEAIKAGDVGLRGGVLLVRPNQSSARLSHRRIAAAPKRGAA